MKKFVIQFIVLLVVIFGALAIYASKITSLPFVPERPKTSVVQVKSTKINVEVADTAAKRKQGLGGRQSLASDSGMLFIFEKPDVYKFWMKGLSFPLDLIWIRDETVVDIIKNAVPPMSGQKDETLPLYAPSQPIDKVLEVSSGFVDNHGIQVGDTIIIQ